MLKHIQERVNGEVKINNYYYYYYYIYLFFIKIHALMEMVFDEVLYLLSFEKRCFYLFLIQKIKIGYFYFSFNLLFY